VREGVGRDAAPGCTLEPVVADGGRGLQPFLDVAGLEDVRVYELDCRGLHDAEGATPWHGIAWYTRNASPQ